MIRSSSEAICETVGSIMQQHCGKNRHLEPEYFNMEMVLRCNLGPMHLLGSLADEIHASDNSKIDYSRSKLPSFPEKSVVAAPYRGNVAASPRPSSW